jgi:hypothetical protein
MGGGSTAASASAGIMGNPGTAFSLSSLATDTSEARVLKTVGSKLFQEITGIRKTLNSSRDKNGKNRTAMMQELAAKEVQLQKIGEALTS